MRVRWRDIEVKYPVKHHFIGGETVFWRNIWLSLSLMGIAGSVLVESLGWESLSAQNLLSALSRIAASVTLPKLGRDA